MDKGQGLSINTIIIAAIALIVLVVLIAIFTGRFNFSEPGSQMYAATVCDNLDQKTDDGTDIFLAVRQESANMQENMRLRMDNIKADEATVRSHTEEGVLCDIPVVMCENDLAFCLDMHMILPVNYTQWQEWRN